MSYRLFIFFVIGVCFQAERAEAQIVREEYLFLSLGYGTDDPSPIVPLTTDRFVVMSPYFETEVRSGIPNLIVVNRAYGKTNKGAVGFLTNTQDPSVVWRRPFRLDDTSCVCPGTGLDNAFGTADDTFIIFYGLGEDEPSNSVQLEIGGPGIRPGFELMVMGPRQVAWLMPGADGFFNSGDEFIRVADFSSLQGVSLSDVEVSAGGLDLYQVEMTAGRYGLRLSGPDGEVGSLDDMVGVFELDRSSQPILKTFHPGVPIFDSTYGVSWPQAVDATTLVVGSPGLNGTFGFGFGGRDLDDDEIALIGNLDTDEPLVRVRSVAGFGLWSSFHGIGGFAVADDGTLVVPGAGDDALIGTPDDKIVFVPAFDDPNGITTIPAGAALARTIVGASETVLKIGSTFVIQHHSTGWGGGDDGVLIYDFEQRSLHTTEFFDQIEALVAMGDSAAAVFTLGGTVYHMRGIGGNLGVVPFDGTHSYQNGDSVPVAISPCLLATSSLPPTPFTDPRIPADTLQFWMAPGIYEYGEASGPSGHQMIAGVESNTSLPSPIGGGTVMTLEDAPPSDIAYLLYSTGRSSFKPLRQLEIIVDLEELVAVQAWPLVNLGPSSWGIGYLPHPVGEQYRGLSIHAQWVVPHAGSWSASNGVTVGF